MALIGYARVSTTGQDPALQLRALTEAGVSRIYTDTISGATPQRPELAKALDYVREGDVLVVWKLDRLGRSLRDLIDQVNSLNDAGVGFRSLTENIDTTTPGGRLIFHVFGALAEFERDLIRERTNAGLAEARQAGRVGGRPTVMTPERTREAARMRAAGKSLDTVAEILGVGRSSISRAFAKYPELVAAAHVGTPDAQSTDSHIVGDLRQQEHAS